MNMLVHPDPIVSDDTVTGKALALVTEIIKELDGRLTVHDIRVLGSPEPKRVIFDCVLPPDTALSKADIKEAVSRRLRERYADCLPVITFDDGYASIPKSGTDS